MARYYARKLRLSLSGGAANGVPPPHDAGGPFATDQADARLYGPVAVASVAHLNGGHLPVVLDPSSPGRDAGRFIAAPVIDDLLADDDLDLSGDEAGPDGAEEATGTRRRRRRRRGGRRTDDSVASLNGTGDEAVEDLLTPEARAERRSGADAAAARVGEEDQPSIPPSGFLTEMVQKGSLQLPDARRRRRHGRDRGETYGLEPAPATAATVDSSTAIVLPAARKGSLDEQIARQNVLLDQMLQRQTLMLKSMERMVQLLERRGVGGSGGGGVMTLPQRVAVFVDVPNIVYAADRIGVQIDWGKVLEFLSRDRHLVRATAYAPISDDPFHKAAQQRFVEPFYKLPYRILTKPLKRFGNGEIKANFDVELAIDVLTMADRLDVVALVSGDGDFRRMVEIVQAKGVRVEVLAFGSSTAGELRMVCDTYMDFSAHLAELSR